MKNFFAVLVTIVVGVFCLLGIFRVTWVTFVDNYQMAYAFDARTGDITVLHESGYQVATPLLVSIHHIDLRPMQVCINANQRVLNCKLVQFNPKGIETFLSWHGRNDYDGPSGSATSNFSEILKSYAYEGSGKSYPFLTIIRELKADEVEVAAVTQR